MKKIKNTSFSINTLIHLFVRNKNKNMYDFFKNNEKCATL